MAKLDTAKITALLKKEDVFITGLEGQLGSVEAALETLEDEKTALEKQIRDEQWNRECLRVARLVSKGIPAKVQKLRSELDALQAKMESREITIRERDETLALIQKTIEKLQQTCLHTFLVTLQTSDGGTQHRDFDDSHRGSRICVICRRFEYSTGIVRHRSFLNREEDDYETLSKSDARAEVWSYAVKLYHDDVVTKPLDFILSKFFVHPNALQLLKARKR